MSNDRNSDTRDNLKTERKALQAKCFNTYHSIKNSPLEEVITDPKLINERINCYTEGVQLEVHNSTTPIPIDNNLLTCQFLNEIKVKTAHIEELCAYTKGNIKDLDDEISSLKSLINIAKEAQSKPLISKRTVGQEHITKAKQKFTILKAEMNNLIGLLFPDCKEGVINTLGELMHEKQGNKYGYIPITQENSSTIALLKDANIVIENPYDNTQVKFDYEL